MFANKFIPVTEQDYLSAVLDQIIYHTKKIHRECSEIVLLIEEESLAMEMYLSLFDMDYVKACASAGIDDRSYILRHEVPLLTTTGDKFSVRLRNPMPFPIEFTEPAPLEEHHEWVMQFRSLISRTREIDNHALIVDLVRNLEALRSKVLSEGVLLERASSLGVYVKKAIDSLQTERVKFASLVRNGVLL